MKETPVGPIPDTWACLTLADLVASSVYGPRFPASSYCSTGNVRQIRTTDFDRVGGIIFSDVPAANLDDETIAKHKLATGDFLLSRSGEYAGLTAVFTDPMDNQPYIPGAFLIRYRLKSELDPLYLLTLCCSEFGNRFVRPLATGSAQPSIAGSAFAALHVPVPPIDEQRRIVGAVAQLRKAGLRLKRHIDAAVNVEETLINMLG